MEFSLLVVSFNPTKIKLLLLPLNKSTNGSFKIY